MPTYQYRCQGCHHELEAFQKFTDDPLTTCTECGGKLRKVYNPVGIVFKGSGFYATDSRRSATEVSTARDPKTAKSATAGEDSPTKTAASTTADSATSAKSSTAA